MTAGPLTGIKIIDLTTEVSGPYATQILADFGAEVIKIESLTGDPQRKNGSIIDNGLSSIFIAFNRNKYSLSIDLKTPEGQEILRKLVSTADVFLHNMRDSAVKKLGIDYKKISNINPKIVYCFISGFNQKGPRKNEPAFDDIIQAACGLTDLNSNNNHPKFLPTIIADKVSALSFCNSILAALLCVHKTGISQSVEIPMFETLAAFTLSEHLGEASVAEIKNNIGYKRILNKGRRVWKTKDGFFSMLPYKSEQWLRIFKECNRESDAVRLGVENRLTRNNNLEEIYKIVDESTVFKTTKEWLDICKNTDIPANKINSLEDLLSDEQLSSSDFFHYNTCYSSINLRQINPVPVFTETPVNIRKEAPYLGSDTVPLLLSLGYSNNDINELIKKNIILTQ